MPTVFLSIMSVEHTVDSEMRISMAKVAVRCHGYTTLPSIIDDELDKRFDVLNWNGADYKYYEPTEKRSVFRAIVKDLATDDVPFTRRVVTKTNKDLLAIRKQGVFPIGINAKN